ncbi:protein LNK1-like isoform X1 [Cucurbita maxima]|uniref:Protein LNK1-like isoform X1 n=2 Tax=Cucurbita maxima TaxID=3661 RepID=A0A6J1IFZ4_CUCMA|nr:protein LNK1-like isoform X1 [Cucurbita maxima]
MLLKWWIKNLEGMSDLCMYKLKDNIWKDFTGNDDYIVPHLGDELWDLFDERSDSLENSNPKISFTDDSYNTTKFSFLGKEKVITQTSIMKNTVLEKDSWPHTPDGVPTSNSDSFKDVKMEPNGLSMPNRCFKTDVGTDFDYCTDDHIVTDNSAADENDMYQYSVSHMSQTGNDISFLDDDCENKENNDLLFYGWQDMESFEDVDRMFRNCDSTFGLGNLSNEDDLCWFSPSHGSEKLEEKPTKSNFNFSCCEGSTINDALEFNEGSNLLNSDPSSDGLNKNNILTGRKVNDGIDSAAVSHLLASDIPDRKRNSRGDLIPKQQESSFASNQLQSVPSSHNPSFDAPTIAANENREKLYHQDLPASFNKNITLMSMPNSETFSTSFPVRKHAPRSESEIDDGHSETGVVSRESRAELDSSNAPDISCQSTTRDGISLEATSFCQLQQVMEQVLDIRTKLCIRDSLYRLARSAEQRHNCANINENIREDKLVRIAPLIDQDANRSGGFLDLETDTNPIDRSVAHLLFHRPSDPSVVPTGGNALPLKSPKLVPAEKQNFQDETGGATAYAADQKPLSNGKNYEQ